MKKISVLLCCVLLLQMFCSCGRKKEEFKKPVNFYYCKNEVSYNSAQAVIQPETREGYGYHDNAVALMHAYLLGPESSELETLIPSDVYLVSCTVENGIAHTVLSSQFANVTGLKLSLVSSAMLMTLHEFVGVEELHLSAKGAKIDDKDVLTLTMDDIVLMDTVTTEE